MRKRHKQQYFLMIGEERDTTILNGVHTQKIIILAQQLLYIYPGWKLHFLITIIVIIIVIIVKK